MSSSRDDFSIAIRSALLQKGTRQKFSIFFLICLSILIFFLDSFPNKAMDISRSVINDLIYRISSVATSPMRFVDYSSKRIIYHFEIYDENKILKEELKNLRSKELRVEYLQAQNKNFKEIIGSELAYSSNNILGRVLLDKESPYLKSVIINKGSKSGIKKGMPVKDRDFLVGRIVETNFLSSRVLLLNDLNSRIPVTIGKSGVQAILTGKGKSKPELEYLPEAYLPENDLIVFTSGTDGIFKEGVAIGTTVIDKSTANVKLYSDPNQLNIINVELKD